jgi:hypothetical protein
LRARFIFIVEENLQNFDRDALQFLNLRSIFSGWRYIFACFSLQRAICIFDGDTLPLRMLAKVEKAFLRIPTGITIPRQTAAGEGRHIRRGRSAFPDQVLSHSRNKTVPFAVFSSTR